MYGLDINIIDIGSLKGASNCIFSFDYGSFESCQFNARNSLTGGVFSVVDTGHETVHLDEFLKGELFVTVVSMKKSFEILCDGKCFVDMTKDASDKTERVLPHLFRLRGFGSIVMDLFYRNKGPTRIKACSITIEMRLYELSSVIPSGSPTTDLENSKVEEEPVQLTEIYVPPESDSSCAEESDDDSITAFMAQFKPINKAVLTDKHSSGHPRQSTDSHRLRSSANSVRSLHSANGRRTDVRGSSASLRRSTARDSTEVYHEPAPTDINRIRTSSAGTQLHHSRTSNHKDEWKKINTSTPPRKKKLKHPVNRPGGRGTTTSHYSSML